MTDAEFEVQKRQLEESTGGKETLIRCRCLQLNCTGAKWQEVPRG